MWCWDTDNEGEFKDFASGEVVGYNDDARQFVIKAGAHLLASGCGIPDGGDKDGKPKMRVICAKSAANLNGPNGDPGAGFRMNRVIFNDNDKLDKLVYRDHNTTKEIGSITFPSGT